MGLLGGTFDPPHYGHLLAAEEAAWQLGLSKVLFLPARQNPLKPEDSVSDERHRCQMVELAIRDNSLFSLSRADLDRPPPSYTVDLLRLLRQQSGDAYELYFLAGADILRELASWHEPSEIPKLARLVIVTRPGWDVAPIGEVVRRLGAPSDQVLHVATPGVCVSSSDIRARVGEGRSIRYLTPKSVVEYIREQGLYGGEQPGFQARRTGSGESSSQDKGGPWTH